MLIGCGTLYVTFGSAKLRSWNITENLDRRKSFMKKESETSVLKFDTSKISEDEESTPLNV